MLTTNDKGLSPHTPKSPILPHPESKSPGSVSQKTPTTLSRQGTLRASHKRKSSMTGSLSLAQGRKSPVGFNNDRSPQGRRSPLLMSSDRLKSPNELQLHLGFGSTTPTARSPTGDRSRSPTFSIHTQERRSPVGSAAPLDFGQMSRRSPTSTVHVQDSNRTSCDAATDPDDARTPTSYKRPSINLFTPIYFSGDKRSPIGPIPPITVSNPAETYRMAESINMEKSAEAQKELENLQKEEQEKAEAKTASDSKDQQHPEKKSVMREILAFVRKPSKHISTRTNRFANAFTRAESGTSSGPLIRQSTFSASPAASSTAAKSAVVKQMSEVGFEPKMSLKFSHYAKMSLKLRRSARDEKEPKQQQQQQQQLQQQKTQSNEDKRPSSDSTGTSSGGGGSSGTGQLNIQEGSGSGRATPLSDIPFELANVHFEKFLLRIFNNNSHKLFIKTNNNNIFYKLIHIN
ncbi:serine-enriched protein-like [Calliphora vicina]|uniref:serine-enriched protein-like n=1 Tax=Calliphora vicina TaxID=7373 RepID=UPI00325B5EAE